MIAEELVQTLLYPLVTVCLGIAAVKLWQCYICESQDKSCHLPLPPGSLGLPIVGETLLMLIEGAFGDFYGRRAKKYGPIFKTHILGQPMIRIGGGELARRIWSQEHRLIEGIMPAHFRRLIGETTVSQSPDPVHKIRRKLLMKAFTPDALSGYTPQLDVIIARYLTEWIGTSEPVKVYEKSQHLVMDAINRVLVGIDPGDNIPSLCDHVNSLTNGLFSLPYNIPGLAFNKGLKSRDGIIEHIKTKIEPNLESLPPFTALSRVLGAAGSNPLTASELRDTVIEFMFAGQSTLSSALTSVVKQVYKHPKVLDKLRTYLNTVGFLDSNKPLTYKAVRRLYYVMNVVREILRVSPPVSGAMKQAVTTFEIEGYQVPKGWRVALAVYNPNDLDSQEFNPERWAEADTNSFRNFLSFGAGARFCAGREYAKLFLAIFVIRLVGMCDWKLINNDPAMRKMPILSPTDGLPTVFTPREEKCAL